jgi:hypothetical protein
LANHRVPPGHPEGYLEAFANLYKNFAAHVRAHEAGQAQHPHLDYPGIEDGVRGMKFIEAIVRTTPETKSTLPYENAERTCHFCGPIRRRRRPVQFVVDHL